MARRYIAAAKKISADWNAHEAPRLGAAFYTILSPSPLLVLAIAISGLRFDKTVVMREVTAQVEALVGHGAAEAIRGGIHPLHRAAIRRSTDSEVAGTRARPREMPSF